MRLVRKIAFAALGLLIAGWLAFSWFEAGREIRILCSGFHAGVPREEVLRTLETGEYLRYRTGADANESTIVVDSLYDLGTTRCVIELEAGRVLSATCD